MRPFPRFRHVLAIAGLLAACAACGGGPGPSAPSSAAPASPPSGAPPGQVNVALADVPAGTVTLTLDQNTKRITAAVNAYGFTPGLGHAMHIHPGNCAAQNEPPSVGFPDITANSAGVINQTVVSEQPVPTGVSPGAYLNIHLAPSSELGSPTDVTFTPIACADIPAGTQPPGPVTLHLAPPPGHAPSGSVQLAYDNANHSLRVDLRVSGLPPNSDHAEHIHNGSCQAEGAVRYGLPDLHADAQGNAMLSTTVVGVDMAPPPSGWYVNVHFGSSSQIEQNGKPTPLFAPILCGDVKG